MLSQENGTVFEIQMLKIITSSCQRGQNLDSLEFSNIDILTFIGICCVLETFEVYVKSKLKLE